MDMITVSARKWPDGECRALSARQDDISNMITVGLSGQFGFCGRWRLREPPRRKSIFASGIALGPAQQDLTFDLIARQVNPWTEAGR